MNTIDINFCEPTLNIRSHQKLLADLDLTFKDHARKNQASIFDESLSNMKFWRIILAPRPLSATWIDWEEI